MNGDYNPDESTGKFGTYVLPSGLSEKTAARALKIISEWENSDDLGMDLLLRLYPLLRENFEC
jgi:hypothetical protein